MFFWPAETSQTRVSLKKVFLLSDTVIAWLDTYDPDWRETQNVTNINSKLPIVLDYSVVATAPTISLATINFLIRGDDEWRVGKGRTVNLGTTHRQALSEYIKAPIKEDGLNGILSEERYGGSESRRIVRDGN